METLAYTVGLLAHLGDIPLVMANSEANALLKFLQTWFKPLFYLGISLGIVTYLAKREFRNVLIYIVIAILASALFWAPEMISGFARTFGESSKGLQDEWG